MLVSAVLSDYFARQHCDFFFLFFLLAPSFFKDVSDNQVLQEGKNILGCNHTNLFTQAKSLCRWLFAYTEVEFTNKPWVAGSVFLWQGMQSHIQIHGLAGIRNWVDMSNTLQEMGNNCLLSEHICLSRAVFRKKKWFLQYFILNEYWLYSKVLNVFILLHLQ